MNTGLKLCLPKVRKIKLNRFTLFTLQPDIDLTIPEGVSCLAGANGIGKSTFLTAVGYGLTGIVPDPRITFRSVEQYREDCLGFNKSFFSGKISEDDRNISSITLVFDIKDRIYELTRGMFKTEELESLKITQSGTNAIILDGETLTPRQREEEYRKSLIEAVGLKSFDQFIFLQHFVFTFDERRALLLWNQTSLVAAMFLAIGADPDKAQRADWLRAEREQFASWGRNYKFQSSNVAKDIRQLERKMVAIEAEKPLTELREKYDSLLNAQARKMAELEDKKHELDDADLQRMESSSLLTSLQAEYSDSFAKHFHAHSRIEFHPSIKTSLAESTCAICGSKGHTIVNNIQQKIDGGLCPLCESVIKNGSTNQDDIEALKEIDKKISQSKKRLDAANKSKYRLQDELSKLKAELESINAEIKTLESENEALLSRPIKESQDLSGLLKAKRDEAADWLAKSEEAYQNRDAKQSELITLYDDLKQVYDEAQIEFVPIFRDLSRLFIGLDIVIRMEYSISLAATGLQLVLEMEGTSRRQTHQLSESQKFFLDIALRMALVRYMSDPQARGGLFIDTPEGSLDIAYEDRAGEMFARFVENGHQILMTANINSSHILSKMALRCGKSKMCLFRMISWAQLSTVQQESEQLFTQTYNDIEALLSGGAAAK